jgi:PAS domain S-box-containing protein
MANSDWFYSSSEFQKFFKGASRSLIIKADEPTFTVLAASDKYLALTHKNREEVLGKGLFQTYPGAHSDPNEKDSVFSSFVRVINSGQTDELPIFKYEISVDENGSKETHYWTNVNEPILDDQGKVAYIINTTTNITEQIRQQNAVLESENRFRLMAEGTDVMIAVGDQSGGAVYFNKAWELATGRSTDELLTFGWVDLMHPDDRGAVIEIFSNAFQKKEPWVWEFRMPARNGQYRWLLARGMPRFTADGAFAGYISSSVDITQQKEQQANLYKLNEELATINEELRATNEEFQQAQEELIIFNTELTQSKSDLLNANTKLEESEHLLKMAIKSSGLGIWIADLGSGQLNLSERGKEIMDIPQETEVTISELFSLIDPTDRDSVSDAMNAAITHDGSFITEYKINPGTSESPQWLRASGIVQKNDEGVPITLLGTILDITEQKLNEQRKNDFISMVSHELKTPLTSVKGYVQILQNQGKNLEQIHIKSLLDKVGRQVGKMTTLINGFLNVSKLEAAKIHIERSKFNVATLIAEVQEEYLSIVSSHRVLFTEVEQALVLADREKINQVLTNLIDNAVKYSSLGKPIKISVRKNTDYVQISVEDEGIGIRAENIPKLFERYYRVEEGFQGVAGFGIGLFLCYEIIKRHDGDIWAESILGKGSIFHFTLPLLK